jgi:hypothetical protein
LDRLDAGSRERLLQANSDRFGPYLIQVFSFLINKALILETIPQMQEVDVLSLLCGARAHEDETQAGAIANRTTTRQRCGRQELNTAALASISCDTCV